MNENQFIEILHNNNININPLQIRLLNKYYEYLVEQNKYMNLTSIIKKEEVYLKHFYDSLTLLIKCNIEENSTLCDVGAGAGFPSIPIKIIRPDIKITIVDSLGKRINFLNNVIKQLNLNGIEAINDRAEIYALNNKERYNYVTARAVAKLNVLAELCIPLVKLNGRFIAMKGISGNEELEEASFALKQLGCKLENNYKFDLPYEGGSRNILIFTKISKTPSKYPRNYSQIKNKPL